MSYWSVNIVTLAKNVIRIKKLAFCNTLVCLMASSTSIYVAEQIRFSNRTDTESCLQMVGFNPPFLWPKQPVRFYFGP